MGNLASDVADVANVLIQRAAAPAQAGIFSGENPTAYNASDPLRLWVIQVIIIIATCQGLSLALSRIRQPRVISEVIGGVILGPTVMGRIPKFQATIFPPQSMQLLTLTSTIGLVLFLFLIGLEIDTRLIKRNAKASTAISVAGLVVPLGLGAALGVAIYREFANHEVNYGYFVLFTAVAVGITAFPVLCRILTELKLLDTTVGVVTLSAGVGNDVIGWVLLALTVALVNASNGLTALYVLLTGVAFVLFLFFPVKMGYRWLAMRSGSLEAGQPSTLMMTLTLLIVFASAFFTDIIGIHPIFGGFLAGLIMPHDNGFAISLVEKIEDLVTIVLLPIYFALSGLKTNLGLLNTGKAWGYTFLICLVAFCSKFFACFTTAKVSGFNIRESGAIGSLMSCKGLVELIVLNVGLSAGILDTRTFSMFVVHAIILTFMTTPLTLLFYPERYHVHVSSSRVKDVSRGDESGSGKQEEDHTKTKFAMILDKIDQLPAAMTLTQLLLPSTETSTTSLDIKSSEKSAQSVETPTPPAPRIRIDALRLIELTARTSAVLRSQEADFVMCNDPVISVFRTFGYLNRVLVSAALSVVNHDQFSTAVADHARDTQSDMVIVPWCSNSRPNEQESSGVVHNPFDGFFGKPLGDGMNNAFVYSDFIRRVFLNSPADVGLFVDRGMLASSSHVPVVEQHLFLPFFGGPDDRLALSFVVQLCSKTTVTATVVRLTKADDLSRVSSLGEQKSAPVSPHNTTAIAADTVYGPGDTQTQLASDTADNLIWDQYTLPSDSRNPTMVSTLSRITFSRQVSAKPLHTIVDLVSAEVKAHVNSGRTVVTVVGRSRRLAVESHKVELGEMKVKRGLSMGSEVSKTVGDVGAAVILAESDSSVLVVQMRN